MPKYRFLHDFRGVINGSTVRHLMGEEIDLDYTLPDLLAAGEVALVEPPEETEEVEEEVDVPATAEKPAHKTTHKVAKKSKG